MNFETLIGENAVLIAIAALLIVAVFLGVRIVPPSGGTMPLRAVEDREESQRQHAIDCSRI